MEPRGGGYFHEVVGSEDEVGEAGLPRDFAHAEESRGLSPAGARLGRQRGVFPEEDGSSAESVRRREERRARGTRSILVRIRITRVLGNSSAIAFSTEKQREFWG